MSGLTFVCPKCGAQIDPSVMVGAELGQATRWLKSTVQLHASHCDGEPVTPTQPHEPTYEQEAAK